MADRPIQVGDLVVVNCVYRCGCAFDLGKVFLVTAVRISPVGNAWRCPSCGAQGKHEIQRTYASGDRDGDICTTVLKRLDPDALKDETPTREEIEA